MPEQPNFGPDFQKPIEKVEEYKFEPIKGYPRLRWKGWRPFETTQFYPSQLKESYGEDVDNWSNRIYWGDNLQVMSHLLKEFRGKINLIYIDPPFDSKADYKKKIQLRGQSITNDQNAFEEKQYTDIWTNDEYLQFIYERLVIMRELLADFGSIFVHCDWHKNHFLRSILEEIFGPEMFKAEIIWKRTAAHNDTKGLGSVTDNILYFSKTSNHIYNPQYVPFDQDYLDTFYRFVEEDGRKYRLHQIERNPALGLRKNLVYEFNGYTPQYGWMVEKGKLLDFSEKNMLVWSKTGKPQRKIYLNEEQGKPVSNIWDDIANVQSQAKERENYPTQKPEALLKRIIELSTNPNDIVFDCFMGSGTTQAVAMKLGRRFIGADLNLGAIQTTTKRLISISKELSNSSSAPTLDFEADKSKLTKFYTGFQVFNVNNYDFFRNELEAKELLIKALEIQPLTNSIYDGEKDGRMVKIMPVNHIATRADLRELISSFDIKTFEKRQNENPGKAVEHILIVCMGHEPDLAAHLQNEMKPYKLDVEVVDILRDKSKLELKRDAEAEIVKENGKIVIKQFYPMNLLQKLSLDKQNIENWKELAESVMIDFNYDGAIFEPKEVDIPEGNALVKGEYKIPPDAGTMRVKITDLLSESLELTIK